MFCRPEGSVVHSVRQLSVGDPAEVIVLDGTVEVQTLALHPTPAKEANDVRSEE